MKFKLVNQGLSPLNSTIKQGYRNRQDAYRMLVGKAYHEAIGIIILPAFLLKFKFKSLLSGKTGNLNFRH